MKTINEQSTLIIIDDQTAFRAVSSIKNGLLTGSIYYCGNLNYDAWTHELGCEYDSSDWDHARWVNFATKLINNGYFQNNQVNWEGRLADLAEELISV